MSYRKRQLRDMYGYELQDKYRLKFQYRFVLRLLLSTRRHQSAAASLELSGSRLLHSERT